MRRFNVIALLLLYISAGINIQELWRMPFLFEHFKEHRQADGKVGFATFIINHYFIDEKSDTESERHRQLPFKATHDDMMQLSVAAPVEISYSLMNTRACLVVKIGVYKSPFAFSVAESNIWQPPRA